MAIEAVLATVFLFGAVAVFSAMCPEFSAWIGVAFFAAGVLVAGVQLHTWWITHSVDGVVPFLVGSCSAVFGLATALAITMDIVVWLLVVAVIVEVVISVISEFVG